MGVGGEGGVPPVDLGEETNGLENQSRLLASPY